MRGIFKHQDYEIEYFVYGTGKKVIFAFHGFNNHAEDFKTIGNLLGNAYTVVSINLFFHGDSHAQNHLVKNGFSIDDLRILFNEISILFPGEKYTLMGYSLGGRIVLKLVEIFPGKIEKAILIAPDGIRISMFYKFLTQTRLGNNLLKRVVDRPSFFFFIARLLKKTMLVSEKKYQWGMGNFDTKQKREKVYLVWMTLRKIISKKTAIYSIIKNYNISVYLFFGKYDRIIPPSIGIKFRKGMEKFISINILDSGHRLLKEKALKEIAEIISR